MQSAQMKYLFSSFLREDVDLDVGDPLQLLDHADIHLVQGTYTSHNVALETKSWTWNSRSFLLHFRYVHKGYSERKVRVSD